MLSFDAQEFSSGTFTVKDYGSSELLALLQCALQRHCVRPDLTVSYFVDTSGYLCASIHVSSATLPTAGFDVSRVCAAFVCPKASLLCCQDKVVPNERPKSLMAVASRLWSGHNSDFTMYSHAVGGTFTQCARVVLVVA
jgi:hypothetical protein